MFFEKDGFGLLLDLLDVAVGRRQAKRRKVKKRKINGDRRVVPMIVLCE